MDKTPDGDQVAYRRVSPLGRGTVNARFWNPRTNLPCQPPPWAHLMAVNANTGDIAWKVTLGTSDELEAKGMKNTGAFGQGGPIVTAGGSSSSPARWIGGSARSIPPPARRSGRPGWMPKATRRR
jgi:glucose dehydrogenase